MFMRAFISALFLLAFALPSRALNHLFIYPLDEFASAPDCDHIRVGYARMDETNYSPNGSGLNFLGGKTVGRHLHAWGSGYANRYFRIAVVNYEGEERSLSASARYSSLSAGVGAHAEPIDRLHLYARAGYSFYNILYTSSYSLSGESVDNSETLGGYSFLLGGSVFATPDLVLSANVNRSTFNENEYQPFFAVNRFHVEASYRIHKDLKASAGILMGELRSFNDRLDRTAAAHWTAPHARLEYRFSDPVAAYVEASRLNIEGEGGSSVGFAGGVRFFLR